MIEAGAPEVPDSSGPAPAAPYQVVGGDVAAARDQVVALWREAGFGDIAESAHRARYEWFYLRSPAGPGQINFLKSARDDRPVGFLGIGVRRYLLDGKPARAGALVDFVVRPDHRTAAPALLLQRQGRERALRTIDLLTGIPDTKALAIFKRIGGVFQCRLPRHVRVLRHSGYLRRKVPAWVAAFAGAFLDGFDVMTLRARRMTSRLDGRWLEGFDDRFDALWGQVGKVGRSLAVRDRTFLDWRFGRQPGHAYLVFAVTRRETGQLQSYFVCERVDRTLVVKDLLTSGSAREMSAALAQLSLAARELGAVAVSVQVHGDEQLNAALDRLRFFRRDSRPFFVVAAEGYGAGLAQLAWYVTQADEDI